MKVSYNKGYMKLMEDKPVQKCPELSRHHLLPKQYFPWLANDEGNIVHLPHRLHLSVHKNFNNYSLLKDPVGCIIKCIEFRTHVNWEGNTLEALIPYPTWWNKIEKQKVFKAVDANPYYKGGKIKIDAPWLRR
jgi:hypothetical protein